MALELSEVVAKFDGGDAEVVYDSTGPFEKVQSATPVAVASFTMPYEGSIIATMWFNPGGDTTTSYNRRLAVEVGTSSVNALLPHSANPHILSCYGALPAGAAQILVKCWSTTSASATTPTRIRVITWRGINA